ncbi:DinB family protein [Gaetbulibacter sp. M235]|uniref:DinB family protein n=1 Tax=Gaetbulibacter sp. M235 TaxID=3126510 RepID=UPI00374FB50E
MTTKDLKTTEYGPYYKSYLALVPANLELIEGYYSGQQNALDFFKSLSNDKLEYRYEENKWTVKELFQHIIDTERIFMYRCLRIARHDRTPLSGFEQNDYIEPSQANKKTLEALLEEYQMVRQNSIILLKSLNENDLNFIGNASGNNLSARAAAFIVLGHELWHMKIIKERYL